MPMSGLSLLRALTIPETYFFRHPGHFDKLRDFALARAAVGGTCHVLSAGTSTGEEAWSAAAVWPAPIPKTAAPAR